MAESEQISDSLILDLNKKGEIVGVEVLGPKPIDVTRFSHPIKVITKKRVSPGAIESFKI